jgi:translation initiation factor SUI1
MDFLASTKCDEAFDEVETYEVEIVHIRIRQRGGRKCMTEVSGLAKDLNLNKIMKYWRHSFKCSVAKIEDKETKLKTIRLQGDKREDIKIFLLEEKIIEKEHIKTHGF